MKWMIRSLLIITVAACAAAAFGVEGVEIVPDVVYGHKHGMALTFDVYKPKQQANGTGILFIVSGGWYSRWRPPEESIDWFRPMLDKGFTVFAVRHGSSPKYAIPEIIEDVRRSVRFIRLRARDFGVDPERLGVAGASAGGHLALMLGTASDNGDPNAKDEVLRINDRVAAVVAYFPPTDLRAWVNKVPDYPALNFEEAKAADCSPLLHVTEDDPPTLLIHGDSDKLVPIDHSEKILAEFKKHNVTSELLVIKGAGHGFKGEDGKRASEAMVAWFEKHLLIH
jgi:acetyl esterase/lipase